MIKPRRLKIAFISFYNVNNKNILSGTLYYFSKLLDKYCGDVFFVHDFIPTNKILFIITHPFHGFTYLFLLGKINQFIWKMLGKDYQWNRTIDMAVYFSELIGRKLSKKKYDLIFADKASMEIAFLKTDIPIVYRSDATFKIMQNYYPGFYNLSKASIDQGNEIEMRALQKAELLIYASDWAAESARKDYGVNKEKIVVIPVPPNFDVIPKKEVVLKDKEEGICKFLFIGTDWERKGGEVAVEVINRMNDYGIPSELSICGCIPPKRHFSNKHLNIMGYLSKDDAFGKSKLESAYLKSHFFILPTRAECMGIVFSEASAYGLPIIATDTGGVGSVVYNRENGLLFDIDVSSDEIATTVKNLWLDKDRYSFMRNKARELYESKFSSEIWGATVAKRMHEIVFK